MVLLGYNVPMSENEKLIDKFGREISYLRLSLTDRCNMRCIYCMSEDIQFSHKSNILTLEELLEVSETFVELGIRKIRLTGGEPLIRRGVGGLITSLGDVTNLNELTLTTNGIKLEEYLPEIIAAGIQRINVSLDSLNPAGFKTMGRSDGFESVMLGIRSAIKSGINIRLNSVVLPDHNLDQVLPLCEFAIENGINIAFIEEMPLGETINKTNQLDLNEPVYSSDLQALISTQYKLSPLSSSGELSKQNRGPAKYWQLNSNMGGANSNSQIGFISPHTDNFCTSCNRIRITAQGELLWCLGHENALNLRAILRMPNYRRNDIKSAVMEGIQNKPKQHEFKPHEVELQRFMSMTGG